MTTTLYPTLHEALELHERLLLRFGGSAGVRDMGLIESALFRPMSGYYSNLAQQAAAMLQSFACNQPFVDGNKRVAWAITAIFLRMNGYRVVVSMPTAERFLIDDVIVGKAEIDTIGRWLEQHMQAV